MYDGGNLSGGGAAGSGDHKQKLHKVVVDGGRGGLANEDLLAAANFSDLDPDLTIGKTLDGDLTLHNYLFQNKNLKTYSNISKLLNRFRSLN